MSAQDALNEFDNIYNETYEDILKYVICNSSNLEDVKDIIQNVYLELLRILKKNKSVVVNKAYLMGIARHKIKDYYRFNYKRKILDLFNKDGVCELENLPDNFNLEEFIIKNEDINKIWDFLKKKNIIIGQIFYLYYYANLTIKEVSKELNLTESNVKNYLYRTLHELNIYLMKGDKNE